MEQEASERELYLVGATGAPRAELHDGKEHLIVPVIALMEGVIQAVNAPTPEFVPGEVLIKNTYGWNGRPVVVGHPARNGVQISANDPKVLEQHKFGTIFQTHTLEGRLRMEAWVDPKRLEALGQHELLNRVRKGLPIEVSVGAFVRTLSEEGTHKGKKYKARWAELVPDHLAFLPTTRGACSIEMGCGAYRAAEGETFEGEIYRVTEEGLETLGGPGSGWHAEDGHVPGSQGGSKVAAGHKSAASAHEKAAEAHEKAVQYPTPANVNAAVRATKDASSATKVTGATPYSSKAAKSYSSMAHKGEKLPPHVQSYHSEAAKMHRSAAREHHIASSWSGKQLEEKTSLKERLLSMFKTLEPQEEESETACSIGYQTLQSLLEGVGECHDEATEVLDDLISAEEDGEDDEEVECARLDSIVVHCQGMISQLSSTLQMIYKMQVPNLPAPSSPRYMEELRAAIGKRNNATDLSTIQQMHDNSVALGASCTEAMTAAETREDGGVPAEGETTMTKEQRTETIAALTSCSCSGFTKDDVKTLEGMPDKMLEQLKTASAKAKKDQDDLTTAQTALKAATEKTTPKALTEEEFLQSAPESIRTLVADRKALDAARKTALVDGILKAAEGIYTKEELEALDLKSLEKVGKLVQLQPEASSDYSFARPIPRTAADKDVYANPPDPYAPGVEKLRAAQAAR